MEDIEDIIEILALCDEEIKNNDENITATLDLQDLKALKNLWNLYNKKIEDLNQIKHLHQQEKEKNEELEYQNKILQEKNQDYKCNYDIMAEQKEKALEKVKQLEEHQKQYLDGELITAKQGKFFEKMIKENYISKDKIREKIEQAKQKADDDNLDKYIKISAWEELLEEE